MRSLVADLIPAAIGVIVSPLAIIAVVVVLLSRRPGPNGIAFFVGWFVAIVVGLAIAVAIASALHDDTPATTPDWVPWFHLGVGAVLLVGALAIYRRGHRPLKRMAAATSPTEVAAAAPQLPGWLAPVEHFDPARSALLGFGLCLLNPVDVSFLFIAAVAIAGSTASDAATKAAALVYVAVAASSVGLPVLYYFARRSQADDQLRRLKDWLARSSGLLNVAMLAGFGAMQVIKGLRGL